MSDRPLLMIPGPIELSPAVREASAQPPPSHTSPELIAAFGRSLAAMRGVWRSGPDSQPFVVAGSGTLAMEMAVTNLLEPGQTALVVNTGTFSDRMATMLQRRGVTVRQVQAEPGDAPAIEAIEQAMGGIDALFATHVDTSTGVRVDARAIAKVGRDHDALVVLDGVCATAGERCDTEDWGVDVVLTASQKAIGAPPGLALLVASPRALAARARLKTPPPLTMDFDQWRPIMDAYEAGRPSYFATPATSLVLALDAALAELSDLDAVLRRHATVAAGMRRAWHALGLQLVAREGLEANTLSAIRFPDGVGPDLPGRIGRRGVSVAGGLHPAIKSEYFRVGHMGYATTRSDWLARTVDAVASALIEAGHRCDPGAARSALSER